ncbi:MAG: GIY-YIG nuclease family protein [bacterium]
MFYTYILLLSNNTYYTGITDNLVRRLLEHNQGKSKSTCRHRPVILKHIEKFKTRAQARAKEIYIKNMGAKRYLNKLKFSPHIV